MKSWHFYDLATGQLTGRTLHATGDEQLAANIPPGCGALEGELDAAAGYVLDGAFAPYTDAQLAARQDCPGAGWVWNAATFAWDDARTLEQAKAQAWARVKQARADAIAAGITVAGVPYDTDEASLTRIQGAITGLQLVMEPGATVNWTAADNTVHALSLAQLLAVGGAIFHHIQDVFDAAQVARAAIEQAPTNAAADAAVLNI